MSSAAIKESPRRFTTKAQWAKAKAEAIYAQAAEIRKKTAMTTLEWKKNQDAIASLNREASRFLTMSFHYEDRGL